MKGPVMFRTEIVTISLSETYIVVCRQVRERGTATGALVQGIF